MYLDNEVAHLTDRETGHSLSELDVKMLAFFRDRQKRLESRKPRDKLGVFLLGKTGLVERAKQRVTSLTQAEEIGRMEEGWKFWDYILQLISEADPKNLHNFIAQPERLCINVYQTVISLSLIHI